MSPSLRPLLRLFDLRRDQETPENIDREIGEGINTVGTNLWVLVLAIFIASIGLNVNSTAVIIGAMLISPLMGPIVGIGYAAGVNDFVLLRRASRNLAVMTVFSLITATLYFSLTPLQEAQSELLARTSPTLWDVLIAFFGGAAGIVAITRKEISNVVPGVAIATALMPPLCTTGYGIANGNWEFAAGAFYLFSINSVFIALATLAFVKIARLPIKEELEPELATRHRWIIFSLVTLTIGPSVFLAWRLVQEEHFEAAARAVVREYREDQRFYLLAADVDGKARSLRVAITGEAEPGALEAELAERFRRAGMEQVTVAVRRTGNAEPDLKPIEDFLARRESGLAQRELDETRQRALALETENAALRQRESIKEALLAELDAQFPEATRVTVASGHEIARAMPPAAASGTGASAGVADSVGDAATAEADVANEPGPASASADGTLLLVQLTLPAALDPAQEERLLRGWRARFPGYEVRLDGRVDASIGTTTDPDANEAADTVDAEKSSAAGDAGAAAQPAPR